MRASDAWKKWLPPVSPENPDGPTLVWPYQPAKRALLVRAQYAEIPTGGKSPWTDSAGVRAVDVLGLDAKPNVAKRALVEFREGSAFRRVWVGVDVLASTPAAAGEKLAAHFSALLAAQRLEQKPVTTTAGGVEDSASSSAENSAERSTTPAANAETGAAESRSWTAEHEARQEANAA